MKRLFTCLLALVFAFTMSACLTGCGHSEEKEALQGVWFYAAEDQSVPMTSLKFDEDTVIMTKVESLDEKDKETKTEGTYQIDDEKIDLDLGGEDSFSLKYIFKDGKISLGKNCLPYKKVKKAIQVVWQDFEGVENGVSSSSYVEFDGNKFVYKMTTKALISFSGNTYSFTKNGTYKLGVGQILLDYGSGDPKSDYWFLFDQGEVFVVCADTGHTMTSVDAMPETVDAVGF